MFLVEGAKSVLELLSSHIKTKTLIGTEVFMNEHSNIIARAGKELEMCVADEQLLSSVSSFRNNNAAVAVAKIPDLPALQITSGEYALVLDDVRDPGNLGTLMRIADWYGIRKIICSAETTDNYNPKVIHASMGSFLRTRLYYTELENFLSGVNLPVYGTFPEKGESVHKADFAPGGLIVLGNESEGIKEYLNQYIDRHIYIPRFGEAESLNVAVAAAVICDNLRRSVSQR